MRCACGQDNPPSARQCTRCGAALAAAALGRWLRDAAAGAGLLLALLIVFLLDRSSGGAAAPTAADESGAAIESPSGGAAASRALRLAVTPPEHDDMGKLLDTLGAGYRHTQIEWDDLLDAARLRGYDVVFLTCGGAPTKWLGRRLRPGERDQDVFTVRPEIVRQLYDALRAYVGQGGTLYASDWQLDLVKIAFPEFADRAQEGSGAVQTVAAEVVEPGLRQRLGGTLDLRFDKPGWRPAALKADDMTVYLRGEYEAGGGARRSGPLMVQIPFGAGAIVFTSFHNEKQPSETELELLRSLVFTTVTARTEASVRSTMLRGGFSPVERSLLSASARDQSFSQSYECRQTQSLQFVLGFEDRGAELRLAVVGPDGTRLEKSGTSTLTLDVPQAAVGTWRYTVTPLKVPYQNFPFTVTVGQKP